MRIALIADEDPGWGGIGSYTGILGRAFRDSGHDVHLVLRGWEEDGEEELDGLAIHRVTVPEPSWRRGTVALVSRLHVARESLLFSARAARALARIAPDVVEAPEFHATGLMSALRSRLDRRAPAVVVRLHTPAYLAARLAGEPADLDGRSEELLEAASVRAADRITSPSAALAHEVTRRWRLAPDRVEMVPNPVDSDLFVPGERAPDPACILVAGRVERMKGQDVLLEALPAIRRVMPETHVRFVGADGGSAAALAARAGALGLDPSAVVFEGALAREELPAVYASAAVCVVPSRFEAFGYTCVEAMACGRPVVASRVGGLAEIVEHEREGLLVAPEDPAALAAAVIRLLGDPDLGRRLGAAARAGVLERFGAPAVAVRSAAAYAEIAR